MNFMTHDHAPPPTHILADGLRHPVAPLIRREDIHRLSQLGVLRHITAEGPAPLGYGPWQLAEDAQGPHYYREPLGTLEQRDAAVRDAALRAQWASQAEARQARDARAVLTEAPTPETLPRHLAAIRLLTGA